MNESNSNAAPLAHTIPAALRRVPGLSRTMLYGEIGAGRLAVTKIGRRTFISERALREWLDARERESATCRGPA